MGEQPTEAPSRVGRLRQRQHLERLCEDHRPGSSGRTVKRPSSSVTPTSPRPCRTCQPGCGIAQRGGYRIPSEVVSVPWVKVGTAIGSRRRSTSERRWLSAAHSSARTIDKAPSVVEVLLYAQHPDWSAKSCYAANVMSLGVPLGKTARQSERDCDLPTALVDRFARS